MRAKIEKTQNFLRSRGWDSWVILTENNRDIHSFYLTGRRIGSRHAIVVHAMGRPILLLHQAEIDRDNSLLELDNFIVLTYTNPLEFGTRLRQALDLASQEILGGEPEHPFVRLRRVLDQTREQQPTLPQNTTIVVNYLDLPYHPNYRSYDVLYASEHIFLQQVIPSAQIRSAFELQQHLRDTKTPLEIQEHKEAAKIGTEILNSCLERIMPNKTELDLSTEFVTEIQKSAEPVFFPSVAAGESTAEPYHRSSTRKAHREEPITINLGLRVGTTCADITWTLYLGKNPPVEFIQLQQIVSQTIEAVPSLIKPILRKREFNPMYVIDDELRNNILAYGLHEDLLKHPVGHNLGIEPHDGFIIGSSSERRFKEDMIISIEPGLYLTGKYGFRQGENYVIGRWRVEKTTHAPHELLTI